MYLCRQALAIGDRMGGWLAMSMWKCTKVREGSEWEESIFDALQVFGVVRLAFGEVGFESQRRFADDRHTRSAFAFRMPSIVHEGIGKTTLCTCMRGGRSWEGRERRKTGSKCNAASKVDEMRE